jgi:hypothetical protein
VQSIRLEQCYYATARRRYIHSPTPRYPSPAPIRRCPVTVKQPYVV